MYTKTLTLSLITSLTLLLSTGCASSQQNTQKRPHFPKDPAAKKAMLECLDTVSKDENGRPDRQAVQACMQEKGFEEPKHDRKHN